MDGNLHRREQVGKDQYLQFLQGQLKAEISIIRKEEKRKRGGQPQRMAHSLERWQLWADFAWLSSFTVSVCRKFWW